jgi:hypothetical protein
MHNIKTVVMLYLILWFVVIRVLALYSSLGVVFIYQLWHQVVSLSGRLNQKIGTCIHCWKYKNNLILPPEQLHINWVTHTTLTVAWTVNVNFTNCMNVFYATADLKMSSEIEYFLHNQTDSYPKGKLFNAYRTQ